LLGLDAIRVNVVTANIDLASLLSPTSVQTFLQSCWTRSPFVARSAGQDRFGGLLDLAEFEFLLSAVAAPGWLSFVSGTVKPPSREQLTRDGTLDVAAVHKAVAGGQSLLLTKVHRLHPATGRLCRQIAADFRGAGVVLRKPVRANAYFTPPHAQGFEPHYDDHEVLVLQLHGEKHWRIYGEAVKYPRRPMLDALDADFPKANAQALTLHPGDVLYVPRGFVHEADAKDTPSLHLTLSIQAATWSDVFERLVELDDRLGEPLPQGFCAGGVPQAGDKAAIARIAGSIVQGPGANRAMADIFNSTFIEGDLPLHGHLARMNSAARVEPATRLAVAEGLHASLEWAGDTAVLRLPGAVLRADKQAAFLFQAVCAAKPFRLCDLAKADVMALVDLAQELVTRGVLIPDPPTSR
jgi:Cupin superfamily protein